MSIVIARVYRASLQDVWDLWTTKEGFESWWGPEGFRGDVREIDARAGGVLRYEMAADTAEMIATMEGAGQPASHPVTARFSVFEPRTRLVLTSMIDFLPGVEPYENDITVTFEPLGDSVRMTVTLSGMHDPAFTQMQKEGFTSQLSKLDRRFGWTG